MRHARESEAVASECRGDEREAEEMEELGRRKTIRKHDLRQPSDQERIEHKLTHLPFRSRCRRLIRGRGREEDCRTSTVEERNVPDTSHGLHVRGCVVKIDGFWTREITTWPPMLNVFFQSRTQYFSGVLKGWTSAEEDGRRRC